MLGEAKLDLKFLLAQHLAPSPWTLENVFVPYSSLNTDATKYLLQQSTITAESLLFVLPFCFVKVVLWQRERKTQAQTEPSSGALFQFWTLQC